MGHAIPGKVTGGKGVCTTEMMPEEMHASRWIEHDCGRLNWGEMKLWIGSFGPEFRDEISGTRTSVTSGFPFFQQDMWPPPAML